MHTKNETVRNLIDRIGNAIGQVGDLDATLVRTEIIRDASALGKNAIPLVLGMPLMGLGYMLGCISIALALMPWLGISGGFAVVAGLNLIVGGLAIQWSLSRLRFLRTYREPPVQAELAHFPPSPIAVWSAPI